jgi:hypothetical protein
MVERSVPPPSGTSRQGRGVLVLILIAVLTAALLPVLSPGASAQSPSPEMAVPTASVPPLPAASLPPLPAESLPPPPSDAPSSSATEWEYRTLFVTWDSATLNWVADFSDGTRIEGLDAILNNEGRFGWELVAAVPELWQQIVENAIREDARRLRLFFKKPVG